MKRKILLVDDDKLLTNLISDYLLDFGIVTYKCPRGDQAIAAFERLKPDLVVLELALPGMSGMEVCRRLRQTSSVQMLILTADNDPYAQIIALEMGADDFVQKPVELRLLLARLRALLRRGEHAGLFSIGENVLKIGRLEIRLGDREVIWRGNPVPLRTKEFDVLLLLARQAGQIVSRDQIHRELRGISFDGLDRSMDNYICRLRRYFEESVDQPERIKTVWGRGYLLSPSAW